MSDDAAGMLSACSELWAQYGPSDGGAVVVRRRGPTAGRGGDTRIVTGGG